MTEPVQAPGHPAFPPQGRVPTPEEGASEQELIAALVAALIAGASLGVVARAIGRFEGVSTYMAVALITEMRWQYLISATAEEIAALPRHDAPSVQVLHQASVQNAFLRAVYLVNASRRLAPAFKSRDLGRIEQAKRIEEQHMNAHRDAERKRTESAIQVAHATLDRTPDERGEVLLGWKAVLDSRTSIDCRQAHGRNFNALVRPLIGYPGSVHLHCRCIPVSPYSTHKRVETVRPDHGN